MDLDGTNYIKSVHQRETSQYNPVAYFSDLTSPDNPKLEKVMGSLTYYITPKQFSEFCHAFCDGIAYIEQRYGTKPTSINIIDAKDANCESGAFFNPTTSAIFLTREWIKSLMDMEMSVQGKTLPFLLDAYQMGIMVAVEEAFHAHQHAVQPEKFVRESKASADIHPNDPAYENIPLEMEAKEVVHQAMIDFGFVKTAPLSITQSTPENMQWAAPYLRERTQVQMQPANNIAPLTRSITTITTDGQVLHSPLPELNPSSR